MDLIADAKQKNDQLLLQNVVLQQHLCASVNTSEFRSFLITFAIAPFIVGAAAQLAITSKGSLSHQLYRAILPCLRFWSPF